MKNARVLCVALVIDDRSIAAQLRVRVGWPLDPPLFLFVGHWSAVQPPQNSRAQFGFVTVRGQDELARERDEIRLHPVIGREVAHAHFRLQAWPTLGASRARRGTHPSTLAKNSIDDWSWWDARLIPMPRLRDRVIVFCIFHRLL